MRILPANLVTVFGEFAGHKPDGDPRWNPEGSGHDCKRTCELLAIAAPHFEQKLIDAERRRLGDIEVVHKLRTEELLQHQHAIVVGRGERRCAPGEFGHGWGEVSRKLNKRGELVEIEYFGERCRLVVDDDLVGVTCSGEVVEQHGA